MPVHYEEHREIRPVWGWVVLFIACVAIVAWGVLNYLTIPDLPRRWDMGVLRDVPGQSIYSSAVPSPRAPIPRQMAPLPEGRK